MTPLAEWRLAVLVVDDEESVRLLVRRLLESDGFTMVEAADGDEALRLADRHAGAIRVLLTDVLMPGQSSPLRQFEQPLDADGPVLALDHLHVRDRANSAARRPNPPGSLQPTVIARLERHIPTLVGVDASALYLGVPLFARSLRRPFPESKTAQKRLRRAPRAIPTHLCTPAGFKSDGL